MPDTSGLRLPSSKRGVEGGMTECQKPPAEFLPILLPRKAPENQEEEEERAELSQSEEPEASESNAGGP